MIPVSPVIPSRPSLPERVIAEHQKEYLPLPAIVGRDGQILTRWMLTPEEKKLFLETGCIYLIQWTGGGAVQPMWLQVETPIVDMTPEAEPGPAPGTMTAEEARNAQERYNLDRAISSDSGRGL